MRDWYAIDRINVWHHRVIERGWVPWSRAVMAHAEAWRPAWSRRWDRWRPALPSKERTRKERTRMEATSTPTVDPAVVGRAILTKFDADTVAMISAALREELRPEVYAQALDEAKTELETAYELRRIRLQDQVSKAKEQAEFDAELRIEQAIAKGLDAAKADLDTTVLDLREERDQARQAQESIVDVLLSLVRQVIPTRKTYLFSRGIQELDVFRLNVALRPHGLRVRSEGVPQSERQVQTLLTADRSEPRALFWTEAVPKGATADEDEPMIGDIPAKYIVKTA